MIKMCPHRKPCSVFMYCCSLAQWPAPNGVARPDAFPRRSPVSGELAAYVCVSPARPESDGGARPESVHPSVGKNS